MSQSSIDPMIAFSLAGLVLRIKHIDDGLFVDRDASSRYFFCSNPKIEATYDVNLYSVLNEQFPVGEVLFKGDPWNEMEMPYRWEIIQLTSGIGIQVRYDEPNNIQRGMVVIEQNQKQICYYLHAHCLPLNLDLYHNPLGILLSIYLAHYSSGFVIHASGVKDGCNGYLFTGVSGIGKSTMAQLWKDDGAEIINDDRLMVMPTDDGFVVYNTPMPYYADKPQNAPLKAMFLLRQSAENKLMPIKGASAIVKVMANCMQHLHANDSIQRHLAIMESVVASVPVFELFFKPDGDVVRLVRDYFAKSLHEIDG